jgi:hypothetical protein
MVQVTVPLAGIVLPLVTLLLLLLLLYAAPEYFYTKVQHLNWMLESIAADIRQGSQPWQGGAIDKAHQLIPIQKFMTRWDIYVWFCWGWLGVEQLAANL